MPLLYVCFLENDTEIMEHHWLNRVAANLAPKSTTGKPKIHVELFFPSGKETAEESDVISGKACSIYYNSTVFFVQKNFSRKQWSFRTLNVNDSQYKKVKTFCQNHVGDQFNHLTYFTYPLKCNMATPYWATRFGYKPRWFCSEIVTEALKAGNILDQNQISSIHPQELFTMLESSSTPTCARNYSNLKITF